MTDELKTTERTELKRVPERGHEDMDTKVWAGLLPINTTFGEPTTADDMRMDLPPSPSIANYERHS